MTELTSTQAHARARRRVETWLWTGPLGHLVGGSLDLLVALACYQLARKRGRSTR
jgi:hypothetical protein